LKLKVEVIQTDLLFIIIMYTDVGIEAKACAYDADMIRYDATQCFQPFPHALLASLPMLECHYFLVPSLLNIVNQKMHYFILN